MSDDRARKIAAILAKAEDEGVTDAERETFLANAQRLATLWAIDDAMIDRAREGEKPEEITRVTTDFTGPMRQGTMAISRAVAVSNGCRTVKRQIDKRHLQQDVIGFEGDVARWEMLNASLQVQAQTALMKWAHEERGYLSQLGSSARHRERRQFLFSFAEGLRAQLQRTRDEAIEEAQEEADGDTSVALVIRSKEQRVTDWVDERYGRLTRGSSFMGGSGSASASGYSSGLRADTGGRVRGATRKELGS